MKRFLVCITLLVGICSVAMAQEEMKHEVTVQGSGFFTKESSGGGVTHNPTYSGGVMAGYRYNLNQWLSVEGDYDYFSNGQKYASSSNTALVQTNVNALTTVGVVKIPTSFKLKPYVLAGGGVIIFDPRNSSGVDSQTKGTFVYGGGADYSLTKHFSARVQYRGFVYKAPDFSMASLNTDKFTHSAVPSAGLVFRF